MTANNTAIRAAILAIKPWALHHPYGPIVEVEPLDSSDVATQLDLGVSVDRVRKVLDQLVKDGYLRALPYIPLPGLEAFAKEPRSLYLPAVTRTQTEEAA